jgi:hypothetical protein
MLRSVISSATNTIASSKCKIQQLPTTGARAGGRSRPCVSMVRPWENNFSPQRAIPNSVNWVFCGFVTPDKWPVG